MVKTLVPEKARGLTSFQSASEKFSAGVLHQILMNMHAWNETKLGEPSLDTPTVNQDIDG